MPIIIALLIYCFVVAGLAGIAWHQRKHLALRVVLGTLSFAVFLVPFAWFFGFFIPLGNYLALRNVSALESNLRVGETRAEVESQFGHSIPKPDRLTGYGVSEAEATPGWGDHLGQYSYSGGSAFCVGFYEGVAVYYDVHDRVKFWKNFGSGDGC